MGKAGKGADGSGGTEAGVEALRDALEHSITLSRDRLQEVFDDAVHRGRMTRRDANELVTRLVSRGREGSDDLLRELEQLLGQAGRRVGSSAEPARRAAGAAARAARGAADQPLAQARRLGRRAGVGSDPPISSYESLTAVEVRARLADLDERQLGRVREQERSGKARSTVLAEIDRLLG